MKPIHDAEEFKDLHFCRGGVNLLQAFSNQPNVPMPDQTYSRTTVSGTNVRSYEALTQRSRGGQRAGLKKYVATQVAGVEWVVSDLNLIVTMRNAVQLSQSGRAVFLVAVSQGNVYYILAGDTTWTLAANNTGESPPLNYTGLMFSAANQQKLWFADGINACVFVPATQTVESWKAVKGSYPVDSDGNLPRLICTWRGRTVLSGLLLDPQNWFMSAVDDPTDFDYAPLSPSATQAVAGNNAPLGLIGDVVTGLIPYSDDVLVFGGDHTIYMMRGDPMAGGQIDLVSDAIGMAWGQAWCKDPYGTIYFFSNRCGIYTLVPTQQPVRISQAIEQSLKTIDTGANSIRLIWDDRYQGCHVFVTPLEAPAATTHFFYEQRTGAWWYDQFANKNHNPTCCVTYDGNLPTDRVSLIGGWDGYVYAIDPNATDDAGTPIQSDVLIGPIVTQNMDDILLKDLQAVLGETSGNVDYQVLISTSAEKASTSTAVATGTWKPGRNVLNFVRRAGHAIYVRIKASAPWAMEVVRARLAGQGKVRQRNPK